MRRRAVRVAALFAAFAILTGGDCAGDLFGPVDEPGTIHVSYPGVGDESAVVEINAEDVQSFANLSPGGTTSVNTIVGGDYQVRVILSGSNTEKYRDVFNNLNGYAEALLAGEAEIPQQASVHGFLTQFDDVIASIEENETATCDGTITLDAETAQSVEVTVTRDGPNGSLQVDCESN